MKQRKESIYVSYQENMSLFNQKLKLVSTIFLQVFIFYQIIAFQKP